MFHELQTVLTALQAKEVPEGDELIHGAAHRGEIKTPPRQQAAEARPQVVGDHNDSDPSSQLLRGGEEEVRRHREPRQQLAGGRAAWQQHRAVAFEVHAREVGRAQSLLKGRLQAGATRFVVVLKHQRRL